MPRGSNGAARGVPGAPRRAGARRAPRPHPVPQPTSTRLVHGRDGPRFGLTCLAVVEGPGAGRLGATSAAGPPACPPLLVLRPERGRGRVIQIASSLAGPLPRSRRSRRRVNQPRHRPATGRGRVACPAARRHDPGSSGRSTKGWRSPRLHPVPQPTSTTRRVHGRDRPSRRR